LLGEVAHIIEKKGYRTSNVDATVIAQVPKLAPHIEKMRDNIACALGIDKDSVSVKATTEEGLGFTGNKEGIAAHAVCLIETL
jgi:2-C-methyl-D-erythritol 2,4-cyclodiphosphate synthase